MPTGALTSRSRAPWRHAHLANGGAMEPNRRERRNGLQDRRQPPPGSRADFGCFEQLGHRKPIWASKAAMNARAQRRNGHAACAKGFMYLLGAVPPVHFHVPRRHRKSLARSAPMRQCRSRWCLPVPKKPKKQVILDVIVVPTPTDGSVPLTSGASISWLVRSDGEGEASAMDMASCWAQKPLS